MIRDEVSARVGERLARFGVGCSEEQLGQLITYIGLLTKWNKTVNLTSLSLDPLTDQTIDKLLVEPMLAAEHIRGSSGRLVDLGSGGGSPAIPLKIAGPHMTLTMVESRSRKAAYLREAIRRLALQDTDVLQNRLEEIAHDPAWRHSAQVVSVRAVKMDEAVWLAISRLLVPGGRALWFRSRPGADDSEPQSASSLAVELVQPLVQDRLSELVVLTSVRKEPV